MKKNLLTLLAMSGLCLSAAATAVDSHNYEAHLTAVNANKIGTSPVGSATFKIQGDNLIIHINMKNTPPNIQHWEHFHGNPDGSAATCATPAQDKNKDGYIDLIETSTVSGTTMVPFNDAPHKMDIPTDTYPKSDSKGTFSYTKVVPLNELNKKFAEAFNGGSIDLDKRVIYVHGVSIDTKLPSTVAGEVGHYGTDVTLPIACGEIHLVR
jgi:Cu/Zn superoxide dismutase